MAVKVELACLQGFEVGEELINTDVLSIVIPETKPEMGEWRGAKRGLVVFCEKTSSGDLNLLLVLGPVFEKRSHYQVREFLAEVRKRYQDSGFEIFASGEFELERSTGDYSHVFLSFDNIMIGPWHPRIVEQDVARAIKKAFGTFLTIELKLEI
jgi:hypothetical protein